ncbi:orotate phosphoribosyltransferase [Pyrobaculum neutrophilum]|uniref:Orotate phosphoribosyltransferase n=1 Tax=Pyrobaculum neutrophilum (strain DSM 2338 / JCM 9278 / NBRC 100436 / V24Sta) TaxID=444157 RepID=B1Y9W2_PYRNV|nr:orotate phosphoribosyltransferase [Pyrobaculum neutrophilum]ACB40512.1 orotate phosphoribosyltransferase [Pyrobaculum neutrophilum V24Sta]
MIARLVELGVVKFGLFKLSSGLESPYYVDLRLVLGDPQLLKWAVERYRAVVERLDFDIVAGVATGGIPYASILGFLLGKPVSYVRPEAKGHGLGRQIEGAEVRGRRVVVVDDVLTTGKSVVGAVNALKNAGASVAGVVVFLDREQCGAGHVSAATGVPVYSVYKMGELLEALKPYIGEGHYRAVLEYLSSWRC